MVYFILNADLNHIKIGYSKNPEQRLKQLQTSSSNKLEIYFQTNGEFSLETYLHKKYHNYHIINEWYVFNEEIKDFIEFLKYNVTSHYIIRYFDMYYYTIDMLKEIINVGFHYRSYFIKSTVIEDLSLLTHKHQLIKKIFDENFDYVKFSTDIRTHQINEIEFTF